MRSDGGAFEEGEKLGDEGGGGVWGDGRRELGGEGDGAQVRVSDGVLDGVGLGIRGPGAREVDGGDLEAVEEEPRAAGVELVGGEAIEDLADGDLDGAAILGIGEGEGGGAELALREIDSLGLGTEGASTAGVVVVVAEILAAKAGASAAVAVGEDVTALEAAMGGGGRRLELDTGHARVPLPPGYFGGKVLVMLRLSWRW